jgi:threonine/homoserine/homoserine lactone efflux protein
MIQVALPTDRAFQEGLCLAVFSPVVTLFGGAFLLSVTGAHPEVVTVWGIAHVVAFGAIQLVWLTPLAATCALTRRRRFALGLVVGGVMLLLGNALAWVVGLAIWTR